MNKLLKSFIKQVIAEQVLAEALSEDGAYKAKIKSLFEAWINKFSASYIHRREQNYPEAWRWTVKEIKYADKYQYQYIKLLFNEKDYVNYTLIFEHEKSIYIANDRAFAFSINRASMAYSLIYNVITRWHNKNYLFKLSVSDFEIVLDIADSYKEFIALCSQMDEKHVQ